MLKITIIFLSLFTLTAGATGQKPIRFASCSLVGVGFQGGAGVNDDDASKITVQIENVLGFKEFQYRVKEFVPSNEQGFSYVHLVTEEKDVKDVLLAFRDKLENSLARTDGGFYLVEKDYNPQRDGLPALYTRLGEASCTFNW